MTIWIPILWIATGSCLFAGLHFLTIGRSKGNAHLFTAFGVMALVVGIYIGISALLQTPGLRVPWLPLERVHMAVACGIYPAGVWFIALFSRLRHWRRWVAAASVLFAAALVANLVQPGSVLVASIRAAPDLVLPWGEHIKQVVPTAAPTALAYDVATLLVFVWAFWRCWALARHGDWRRARALLAFLVPQLVAAAYSEYTSVRDVAGLSGLEWSAMPFLLLVVAVSEALIVELRRNATQLDASVTALHAENARRAEAEAHLRHMAYTDAVTGLPNRHALDEWLREHAEGQTGGAHGALYVIDPSRFAVFNHVLGKHNADLLLREIGERLQATVGADGYVARLDGDEFAVATIGPQHAADSAASDAMQFAKHLRDALGAHSQVGGSAAPLLAVHMGFTLLQADGDNDTRLRHAYAALQDAKISGHRTPIAFAPSMEAAAARRLRLETDLHTAIAQRQLTLAYQPQVDGSDHLVGAEALLRWRHPELGAIPPSEFIDVAERSGQMVELGRFVLETACTMLAGLPPNPRFRLAVNISPQQLWLPNFVDVVRGAIAYTGADPHRLTLEITETVIIRDLADAAQKIEALNALGIRVSVDDFGTGHAAISSLKSFAVGELKIDQSFVADMSTTQPDRFVIAMITLGHALNLNIVAEGVEREDQRQALLHLGCDTLQGYLIGASTSVDELAMRLQAERAIG